MPPLSHLFVFQQIAHLGLVWNISCRDSKAKQQLHLAESLHVKSVVSTEPFSIITKEVHGNVTPTDVHSTLLPSKDILLCIFLQELLSKVVSKLKAFRRGVLLCKPYDAFW